MKKIFFTLFLAIMATTGLYAQQISVVTSGGATTMYQTLADAINGATPGSVIYLPGGGFQISDDVKINKKLTIMGVGHRGDTGNPDGGTTIAGNLIFREGSSGSAVVGVYISGNIDVGDETGTAGNLTIRYCNINSIQVHNSTSNDMLVNQCYLRDFCDFGGCNVRMENNIMHSARNINGGTINHNILVTNKYWGFENNGSLNNVNNTSITNNFFLNIGRYANNGSNCYISNNCLGTQSWGENPILLEGGVSWSDVFEANYGVSISSNYNLKGKWGKKAATDGSDIGIYGGNGFKDSGFSPIPHIVAKDIPEQTDASGMLKIKIRVKAAE